MQRDLSEYIQHKKAIKKQLFSAYSIPKNSRAVILNAIENTEIADFIDRACAEIGVTCLREVSPEHLWGVDACISDMAESAWSRIAEYLIVPIFPEKSMDIFAEFNPMKFEGNAFLFVENKPFHLFEKICRFLENGQYAGDRRMLLKNLLATPH